MQINIMGYKLGYHILVLPNQVFLINSVPSSEVLLYVRKEEFKQATVYLCNNDIRFVKGFYPSALCFLPSLQFEENKLPSFSQGLNCQNVVNFLQNCSEGEKYKAEG